jgi:ubiquinone/menaquinone biosynthesis C-methylase UbiE
MRRFSRLNQTLVAINEGDVVLDVATGTGNYLLAILERGAIGYGMDHPAC